MKNGKKLVLLVLLFAFVFVTGCGNNETNGKDNTQATEQETQNQEETQETEMVIKDWPANTNLLTGLADLSDDAIGKRPVAVMINNVNAALP